MFYFTFKKINVTASKYKEKLILINTKSISSSCVFDGADPFIIHL